MSFAKSFYADQKQSAAPSQQQQSNSNNQFASSPSIPANAPIAEQPLSPSQIQEAIRIYRSMLSSSAPSSPVQYSAEPEKPVVHSSYYGGGPTDIPTSYMVKYNKPTTPTQNQLPQAPAPIADAELIARLQNLTVQAQQAQQYQEPPTSAIPPPPLSAKKAMKAVNQAPKIATRMYDADESGYCFNRPNKGAEDDFQNDDDFSQPQDQGPEGAEEEKERVHQQPAPVQNYEAPQQKSTFRQSLGPSEYIGMANDCKFIYDNQCAAPASYTSNNNYTLVQNNAPTTQMHVPAQAQAPETEDYNGATTTEDVTQLPCASPAVHSRFRGMIHNIASTPTKSTAPIVVERIDDSPVYQHQNHNHNQHYDAFMPVNRMISAESEYQLPVLNDLASCIEPY